MSPLGSLEQPAERLCEGEPQLPCWLTEEEAEALVMMCAASPRNAGEAERRLFAKLGEMLRAFRR